MSDLWEELIGRNAKLVQQIWDSNRLYQPVAPRAGATDRSIAIAEGRHGPLPPAFVQFLRHCNGWPNALVGIGLFGTEELCSDAYSSTSQLLGAALEAAPDGDPLRVTPWLVLGADPLDLDVIAADHSPPGADRAVLWIAGGVVERYDDFLSFFRRVVALNEDRLRNIREPKNQ